MAEIVQIGHPALKKISKEVPILKIGSSEIKKVIKDLLETLEVNPEGVALSAPQIAQNFRIFVVSHRLFENEENKNQARDLVFINPKIKRLSREKKWMEEGCLSIRDIFGEVKRSTKASIDAYDENGKKLSYNGSDLMAQIFQHEIDHLDGILFVEKARNLHKYENKEDVKTF